MDTEYLTTFMFLGGFMSLLGLAYLIFGFFLGGLRGNSVIITGNAARFFGFCYILLGLPVFAFCYGASQAPEAIWYLQMTPYINEGNYLMWMIGWVIVLLILHVISGFVGQSD